MSIELARAALFLIGVVIITIGYFQPQLRQHTSFISQGLVKGLAVVSIGFMVFLYANHLFFPLHLDLMEGTVLQHVRQLIATHVIYTEPTPEFVPLAYNPLYYAISMPFVAILGANLPTMRLVAIIAMIGIAVVMFLVIKEATDSTWWGIIGVGLFAAAYRVMDTYLDNAHSDSWFLFSALLGTYIISKNRSYAYNLVGIAVLVASFWFKQHGVIFVAVGLVFLLCRDGWLKCIGYVSFAGILGAGAYLFLGPVLFGPYFLYFTYQVPRQWSTVNVFTFLRYFRYIVENYPLLSCSSVLGTVWTVRSKIRRLTIWHFQLVAALLAGLMGSLDAGSANNVYIPMGIWFILLGTIGLYDIMKNVSVIKRHRVDMLAFVTSFAVFLYAPASVIVSPQAQQDYKDFINILQGLHAQVYGPFMGQLQSDYVLVPGAHWVSIEDMLRGPGRDEYDNPTTHKLLASVIEPEGAAYIILPLPLDGDPLIGFLTKYYVLETDYGDRFKTLSTLPKRFSNGWPRYLYRYDPQAAKSAISS
jgi:4-amino-4-deoxy-L-arabinose transferase-like glycosyltransferase